MIVNQMTLATAINTIADANDVKTTTKIRSCGQVNKRPNNKPLSIAPRLNVQSTSLILIKLIKLCETPLIEKNHNQIMLNQLT